MNVTETFEEIYRLASLCPSTNTTPRSYPALVAFMYRVVEMRQKLDDGRRRRARQRAQHESFIYLRSELCRLRQCATCGWDCRIGQAALPNPLTACTGDFGCVLEGLRYKSSEWHADMFTPPKPATAL